MRVVLVACALVACAGSASTSAGSALRSGGLITYSHIGPDDSSATWVVSDDGSAITNRPELGRDPSFYPHWSSDGRRLLFTRPPAGTYVAEIQTDYGVIPRFAPPRRVTRFVADFGLDWSPDETTLVLALGLHGQRCGDLYTMRAGHSGLHRLTATAACEHHPAWSPDGRLIAYQRDSDTSQIVVIDPAGHTRRVIGRGTYPTWSPDGRLLAFLSGRAIAIVDARTGSKKQELQPAAPYDDIDEGLTWSPDGTRLAFGFLDLDEAQPLTHLASISADGTDAVRLTLPTASPDRNPDWRPACTWDGTNFDDFFDARDDDDVICSLRGNDRIRAGDGDDVVYGGDGADGLVGGLGTDWLFGAAGDDRIYARDGVADLVDGGPGVDHAVVDASDHVSGVERVDRR
jgi:Tol biopolymer transport system component